MATQDSHDQYLEKKLRMILESLVESLLATKPDDIAAYSVEWLLKKEAGTEEDEIKQLRAERDALLRQREELRASTGSATGGSGAAATAKRPSITDGEAPADGAAAPTAEDEASEQAKIERMKKGDRRAGVSATAIDRERMKDWKKPHYEKSQEDRGNIKRVISSNSKLNVLFGHLTEASVLDVIDAMKHVEIPTGSNVIKQGDEGDNFYIVDSGHFDIFVKRGDAAPTKVMDAGPGAMFGELALMYNAPRAATVTATEPGKVWALDRESFQMMLATAENLKVSQYEEFLGSCELFKHMTKYELSQLSDLLEPEVFDDGEDIIKQGDAGSTFYILEEGTAKAYIKGDEGELEVKQYLKAGDFFGEVALINREPRRASVRAAGGGCTVLRVNVDDFDKVLGPIRDVLEKNIDLYPKYAEFLKKK